MSKPTSIEERVKQIINGVLGREAKEITEDAELIEDLGADVLDCTEIVMELEKEFNIADWILEDAIDEGKFTTVRDVITLVKGNQNNASPYPFEEVTIENEPKRSHAPRSGRRRKANAETYSPDRKSDHSSEERTAPSDPETEEQD